MDNNSDKEKKIETGIQIQEYQSNRFEREPLLLLGNCLNLEYVRAMLEQQGWNIDVANCVKSFDKCLRKRRYPVVVTLLSEDTDILRRIEHHALKELATKWIAVVPDDDWMSRHSVLRFGHIFYDYHRLPLIEKRFLDTVGHAYGMAKIAAAELETTARHRVLKTQKTNNEIIGKSDAVKKLQRTVKKIADYNLPVLILGESGTGKELIARNLHLQSERARENFITVDCASIPESLIASELFGHERGAFTGADKRMIGKIEAANGGTLFLDEIGDMPVSAQASLLRFLENRKIQRLGSNREIEVDCRVILATHVDLKKAVHDGKFRDDLYHRINVISINIPPLREHREDIADLAEAFLERNSDGDVKKCFSAEALRAMQAYHWPGNVRELRNKVLRAIVMDDNKMISAEDMQLEVADKVNVVRLNKVRELAEQKAVQAALESCGNNHTMAAAKLGISRTSLYRLLDKFESS